MEQAEFNKMVNMGGKISKIMRQNNLNFDKLVIEIKPLETPDKEVIGMILVVKGIDALGLNFVGLNDEFSIMRINKVKSKLNIMIIPKK